MSESLAHANYRLVVMHGTQLRQPPAMQNVIIKVPGDGSDNMLICDIWKSGDIIAAKPVATLLPAELVFCNIWATHVISVTHKYTMLNGVSFQPSFPYKVFTLCPEVLPECIL